MSDITKVKDLPATVTTAIEALRKFAKYLVIPTGVTTFFSDKWLQHMRLLSIKNSSVGTWISVIFWVSVSIVIIDWLHTCLGKFMTKYNQWKFRKKFAETMYTLTDTEKDIVYKIFRNDIYNFDGVGNAAIKKLESLGIIFHADLGRIHSGFSFGLQPLASNFLKDNPDYLEDYVEERKQYIKQKIDDLEKSISIRDEFNYNYQIVQAKIQDLQNMLKQYE
ncbi:superinfection exclusion B family protein [Enterococcus gallinarum]|uniref:superinfection exclusion B family protein n=1 Tax=Enterococcus gallinarum TaxID=1353 RepID=UPI00214CFB80|nr:superinfection exclusion B family protein [Enterococcus gallinarum]MCR1933018.1 superinfection exclusion B family protein [Enterococcus gallinarum]MCR1946121.1 superinfection exclusion B family protein [Enterococcus gallinarum]